MHESLYAAKAAAAGYGHNLDLRVIERYGHTDFSADEAAEALIAGAKGAGRDMVGPGMLDYAAQLRAMIDHDVSADFDAEAHRFALQRMERLYGAAIQ